MRFAVLSMLLAGLPALAAEPVPEITRGAVAPQSVGTVHTLRGIPEACARLEGMFTGSADHPYRLSAVRTSANCQARARFVDADKAAPSVAGGWILNDLITVPSAACPGEQAVVRVWRRPAVGAPPKLDAQGRSRIYLQDSMEKAKADALPAIAMYAASMTVQGRACP